ncbi:MAG: phage holin family protein [Bacteroidota bacterium]
MEKIITILICAVSFYIGAMILSGVEIKSFIQALTVALVVAVLDVTLGTVLKIVSLGILSLGIFNWLLNAILIQVADWFLPEFKVKNFWWALGLAAIVSIVGGIISSVL